MSVVCSNSKVVQVCNISTTCQRDQLKTLFNFFGRIDEVQLYPDSETLTSSINGKVGYIKFDRMESVHAALNLTNTIFIDKPLIVSQVFQNLIPDETDAMIYCAPLNANMTLLTGGPTWPSTVINRLVGQPPNGYIETIDPELTDRNLPPYPSLSAGMDISKVEEIRRTVYLSNFDKDIDLDVLHEFLSQIGEIRYIRAAYTDENAETRGAYVEFCEQTSIPKVLSINGFQFFGRPLLVNHATTCVIKPATVRGLRTDMKDFNHLDEEDLRYNQSRSRSSSHRHSSSRSKSFRSTRSPKHRSRYAMICFIRANLLSISRHSKWCSIVFPQSFRLISSLDISPSKVMRNAEVQTISTETLNVPHQGRLEVRCPFNLVVTPVNQKDFPRLDKAFFTIYGDSSLGFSKETWKKLFRFSTIYSPDDRTLRLMGHFTQAGTEQLSKEAHTLEVYCQIPPQYEVDINCSDNNNVSVEYLHSPRVHVQTKRGECLLKNVVANSMVVHSQSGNITCVGSLHGTIDLSTEREGFIQAATLQGPFVRLKVENSDIRVKSIDSEHFLIQGQRGSFRLGNLHGHGLVDLNSGAIKIASVDGDVSLQCEKGNVDTFFSSTNASTIRAQDGDVRVGVIDTVSVRLNLVGKRVQVAEDAEHFHMETTRKSGIVQVQGFISDQSAGSSIDVTAPKGTIQLTVRDWFSTLKLDKHVDQ